MNIAVIAGCRPNFVKAAPLVEKFRDRARVVYTGQHHEHEMAGVFFGELGLLPDRFLGCAVGPRHMRLGRMVESIGDAIADCDACVVIGDVDSTLAGALAAHALDIPLIHVEAGLRSGDWTMPEEHNRFHVDHLSGLLLTTEANADNNLRHEGCSGEIAFVGNILIDALYRMRKTVSRGRLFTEFGVTPYDYALATFHRAGLVSDCLKLRGLFRALGEIDEPILLPTHPRLLDGIMRHDVTLPKNVVMMDPMPYSDFVLLMDNAKFVITDSGGVQEETTALGVPCLTYRDNTERPATLAFGTNTLVGIDPDKLVEFSRCVVPRNLRLDANKPPLWDGCAADRMANKIMEWIDVQS